LRVALRGILRAPGIDAGEPPAEPVAGLRAPSVPSRTDQDGVPVSQIDALIAQIRVLEEEMQVEYDQRRDDFEYVVGQRRVQFSEQVALLQRESKTRLLGYVAGASLLMWVTAPLIYLGLVPMFLLDGFLLVYQAICFPVYGIAKVRRSDYLLLDRVDLPYLNAIEKLNCGYCGYANGLAAYYREISARTEQYWCPIKHARRIVAAHDRYPGFLEYGDAESYQLGLERLRDALHQARDEAAAPEAG
jgi:hypothetical protein